MGIFGNKDDKKPDFSNVESGSSSTANPDTSGKPDFSDVKSGSSSTAAGGDRLYIVRSGDSLSKIAQREYGDAKKWRRIFEANQDKIKDPDLIHPGQELKIPA
jgi:nucleoid-associated protein YgaU